MSAIAAAPSLRHLLIRRVAHSRPGQRRWAQVSDIRLCDVRFLATQSSQSRILEKYRQQLEEKARTEGHANVDSLKEAYKDRIDTLRKKAIVPGVTGALPSAASQTTSTPLPKGPSPPPPPPSIPKTSSSIKPLSSYLDLSKVLSLPASEIPEIWRLRHSSSPNSLVFSLPVDTWRAIASSARKHPQFVLPLPRADTAVAETSSGSSESPSPEGTPIEIHFLQFAFPSPDAATLLFTHLAEYKLRGEHTTPHTAITFHTELAQSHGLILGQGSVMQGRGVTVEEGQWLLMCLQKFYGIQAETVRGGRGRKLLEKFSAGDGSFKIEDLVDEVERI